MPTMTEPAYYTLSSTNPTLLDNYAVIRVRNIDAIPLTQLIDTFATTPVRYTLVVWCPNEKYFSQEVEPKFIIFSTIYNNWDIIFLTPETSLRPNRRAFINDGEIRKKLIEYEKNLHS